MQTVQVSGRFVGNHGPIEGRIQFTPSQIWVDEEDGSYPTLAPDVELVRGEFSVTLSRTDTGAFPWHYQVISPVGKWPIRVEEDGPLYLRDLLGKRFA